MRCTVSPSVVVTEDSLPTAARTRTSILASTRNSETETASPVDEVMPFRVTDIPLTSPVMGKRPVRSVVSWFNVPTISISSSRVWMKPNISDEMLKISVSRLATIQISPPVSCGTFIRMVPVVLGSVLLN